MAIRVNVRFLCKEVTGNAREGEYLLPKDSTVGEFMDLAAQENGTFVKDYMENVLFIVNGKLADPGTVLKDSDMIRVAGVVYGG